MKKSIILFHNKVVQNRCFRLRQFKFQPGVKISVEKRSPSFDPSLYNQRRLIEIFHVTIRVKHIVHKGNLLRISCTCPLAALSKKKKLNE